MRDLEPRCTELGWSVTRLSQALGAHVEGANLAERLSSDAEATLVDLLTEHLVLTFRNQDLSPDRHVELGGLFGEPLIHPFLDPIPEHDAILKVAKEPSDDEVFGGEFWHADITFMSPPSSVSLLYSIDVPVLCGDTLFANQFMAYEQLSEGMKRFLAPLEAVHVYPEMAESAKTMAVHPVARTHALSGRTALFVNPAFVVRFADMTEAESQPLLQQLFAHQTQAEFQGRITWTNDQLTIWDNRCLLHYAMNDYPGKRRILQRVTSMETRADVR